MESHSVVILLAIIGCHSEILKGLSDNLNYKDFKLENGMQIVIIQDPDTKISGANIAYKIGSLIDPSEYQGLAHLLEHMLSTGTEKHPEKELLMFIVDQNGGYYNAATGNEETQYYFTVKNAKFEEAFDVLADMFTGGLFLPESIDGEIKAIDSEFKMNSGEDVYLKDMILKQISSKNSKYRLNDIGNETTLNKPGVGEALLQLVKKYFTANNMYLVVYSNEEIEKIEKIVTERFSSLKPSSDSLEKDYLNNRFFEKKDLGKLVFFESKQKKRKMTVQFVLSNSPEDYLSNYYGFLARQLFSKHEGSFFHYLTENKLASGNSYFCQSYEKLHDICQYDLTLSEKGLKNYKEVLTAFMKMIKSVKSYDNAALYQEYQAYKKMIFNNREAQRVLAKINEVTSNIVFYPVKYANIRSFLAESFDKERFDKIIDEMTLENSIVIISTTDPLENYQIEPNYITKYTVASFKEEDLKELNSFSELFPAAPKNDYYPSNFELVPNLQPKTLDTGLETGDSDIPVRIDSSQNTPLTNSISQAVARDVQELVSGDGYASMTPRTCEMVYFYQDPKKMKLPKIALSIGIRTAMNRELKVEDILHLAVLNFLLSIQNQALRAKFGEAGYSVSIGFFFAGIDIDVNGFSHHYSTVAKEYFKSIRIALDNQEVTEEDFKFAISKIQSNLMANMNQVLNEYAEDVLLWTLMTNKFTYSEQLEKLESVTLDSYKDFLKAYMQQFCFDALISGNIQKEEGKKLVEDLIAILKKTPNAVGVPLALPALNLMKIPQGNTFALLQRNPGNEESENPSLTENKIEEGEESENESDNTKNNSILIYFQLEPSDRFAELEAELIESILSSKFFVEVRNNRKLGYKASTSSIFFRQRPGFQFVIQGAVADSADMAEVIYKFIQDELTGMSSITEEKFAELKNSLKELYLQPVKNFYTNHNNMSRQIASHLYRFRKNADLANLLDELTLENFKIWAEKTFSTEKKVLEVHFNCKTKFEEAREKLAKRIKPGVFKLFEDIKEPKKGQSFFPDLFLDY